MRLIILGIGSFAEYVSYAFANDSEFEVVGFCKEQNTKSNKANLLGLPIYDFENIENYFDPLKIHFFIAIGNNDIRTRLFKKVKSKGFQLASYISSKSIIWDDLKYGENVFISEDCGIQPFVSIGNNNILIGSKIGHHSIIGNNNLLSCCYLAGKVSVANNCFIGLNATIKQNVYISDKNIIGMNCSIIKNTEQNDVYTNLGTRKRSIKSIHITNKYLN
jgi:sugar O-acyltransferase (sialic acid O-acetyltransferase NeuD family)